MKKLFTLTCALMATALFGQTGPAGIKTMADFEVWLDASQISSASPGATIGLWEDESGNGNNFLQIQTLRRPIYNNVGGSNNKPYVSFTNDYMDSGNIPNLDTDQLCWLYVGSFNSTPSAYQYVMSHSYSSHNVQYATYFHTIRGNIVDAALATGFKSVENSFTTATEFHMAMRNSNTLQNFTNGGLVQTNSTLTSIPTGNDHVRIGARAGSSPTYYFQGNLYEVMAIDASMNTAEINILSNYLASKYSLTPSLELYTHDSGHGENVVGIGQESDGSNLTARGLGIITLSGATLMSDGLYLILGDDNVSLANTSPNVPSGEPANANRFERVWRIGENQGDVGDVTLTLHIDTYRPGTNPTTIKMYVDSDDGDFTNAAVVTGVYDALSETVTFVHNFTDGNYISFGGSEGDIESTGVTSDWHLATTWNCGCIPSLSDSVTILNGHTVTISATGAIARTIVIQSTGSLSISGGDLTIEEDADFQGIFSMTGGELDLAGLTQQTLNCANAATFNDFNVSNANGVVLTGGPFTVNGTFTMAGNIDNSGATGFIINSTAAGDGRIAPIAGSINFTDPITMRRYMPPGPSDYRSMCPLIANWSLSEWDDELIISGSGFPDGCAIQDGSCFYSAKYYAGASGFQDITDLNANYGASVGIHIYVGDDLTNFSGATLESSGTVIKGTYQTNGFTTWNMIGNSYPSAIDFTSLQAVSFRMDNFYYIYDPDAGAYDWWEPLGSGGLDQYIAMGQGFWVLPPTGATQPLLANWNELVKTDQTATFRSLNSSNALYLKISSSRDNFGNKIAFNTVDTSSLAMDNADIPYLQTPNEEAPFIAVKNEYNDLINVSYWSENEVTATFPIIVNTPFSDYYTISSINLENFDQYSCVYLLDLKTNESINLREESDYTFFVDQAKSNESRFLLVCSNDGSCDTSNEPSLSISNINEVNEEVSIQQMNNFFNVTFDFNSGKSSNIVVLNTLGQVVYDSGNFNISKGTKSLNLESHHTGVHFIRVTHGNVTKTKKVFIQ